MIHSKQSIQNKLTGVNKMGYRSTVGIRVQRTDPDAPDIPTVLALAKTKGIISGDLFEAHWYKDASGWDADNFVFYNEDVKWYDGYEPVDGVNNLYAFFEELDDGEGKYRGAFCRIGEDQTDVTVEHFGEDGWELAEVSRSIDIDLTLLGERPKLTDVNKEEA